MADTTFVNGTTLTDADWFNDLNRLHYTILGDPADVAAVNTALGVTATSTGSTSSTFTFNGSGGSTGALTLTWQKTGNWVTLNIPAAAATSGTSSTTLTSGTALAAAARPTSAQSAEINHIRNNGASINSAGLVSIGTNGILTIYRDSASTAWTDASDCGTGSNVSVTYFVG